MELRSCRYGARMLCADKFARQKGVRACLPVQAVLVVKHISSREATERPRLPCRGRCEEGAGYVPLRNTDAVGQWTVCLLGGQTTSLVSGGLLRRGRLSSAPCREGGVRQCVPRRCQSTAERNTRISEACTRLRRICCWRCLVRVIASGCPTSPSFTQRFAKLSPGARSPKACSVRQRASI